MSAMSTVAIAITVAASSKSFDAISHPNDERRHDRISVLNCLSKMSQLLTLISTLTLSPTDEFSGLDFKGLPIMTRRYRFDFTSHELVFVRIIDESQQQRTFASQRSLLRKVQTTWRAVLQRLFDFRSSISKTGA
jgi:hypothetical protein